MSEPKPSNHRRMGQFEDPKSLRHGWRLRRIRPLIAMIESVHASKGAVAVIDVGGTPRYWSIVSRDLLQRCNVSVTIVNLPGAQLPADHGPFRYLAADGCNMAAFTDQSFDIAHSNSVIEHVGDWPRMKAFASEIRRLAPSYFVQTPNYWFPVEPHGMVAFFHWLPRPLRVWWLLRFGAGNWARSPSVDRAMEVVESARLLNRRMFEALFPDGKMMVERVLLLPKSFIAVRQSSDANEASN
ncbi:MAG: class I SAM-dependent methyltransferase [Burkholderiales bacterium]|nr:class I SAM-dependent methyltransferase [Burkholderiales bacterium]